MRALIIHPESVAYRRRISSLRQVAADLVRRRITILFEELPAIRSQYTDLFGDLERRIERKTLELSERRRLVELFSLKLDRGQELDEKTVELTMKAVYKEFERVRSQMFRESESGRRRSRGDGWWPPDLQTRTDVGTASKRMRRELRRLYRRLAKALHPDSWRGSGNAPAAWWELTRRSYDREDLHALRMMANVVDTIDLEEDTGGDPKDGLSPLASLHAAEQRLEQLIADEKDRVRTLCESEPYSLRDKLQDETWLAERTMSLEKERTNVEDEIQKCDRFLAPILAKRGEDVSPEVVTSAWNSFVEDIYLSGRF